MKQKQTKTGVTNMRMYGGSEVTVVEDADPAGRYVMLRFRTWDAISGDPQKLSPTPWVTFPVEALEGLSLQLAGIVETAKRWKPGEKADMIGPGVIQRGPFEES
jgi:hypothetical protein